MTTDKSVTTVWGIRGKLFRALLFLFLNSVVQYANAADVFISSPGINPDTGQQFEVEVSVDSGTDVLGNYFLNFLYDPAVINVVTINGGTTTEFSTPPTTDINSFTAGVTPFAASHGNMASPSGLISLAKINFMATGLTGATTPLTVTIVEFNDIYGSPLDVSIFNSSIQLSFNASADTDGDGLSDVAEANAGTDINLNDTDGDTLLDGFEVLNGLDALDNGSINPNNGALGDPDADGLDNATEQSLGTNPARNDTDNDGLLDNVEISLGTNPLLADSDGDGLTDLFEVNGGLNPNDDGAVNVDNGASGDPDGDGLVNSAELLQGTNPNSADSDNDGMTDDYEILHGLDPLDDGSTNIQQAPTSDIDSDGVANIDEFNAGTDPNFSDSDNDLLSDQYELTYGLDPLDDGSIDINNGPAGDPDADGHVTFYEFESGSDPTDKYSQPVSTTLIAFQGFNTIHYPLDLPVGFSAFDFLSQLNANSDSVSSISRINATSGVIETATWVASTPSGVDFAINPGDGVIAKGINDISAYSFGAAVRCPLVDLNVGVNVIGIRCVPFEYKAFDMLTGIGTDTVISSVQRFNPDAGRFESAFYDNGVPVGTNFIIRAGDSYTVHMKSDRSGFDSLQ